MKKSNVRMVKIVIILALAVMVLFMTNNILATTSPATPINLNALTSPTGNSSENNNENNNSANSTILNPTTPSNQVTNITTSNYTNTNLPQTGDASDYAIFLLIVVSIIIAIFAYKKVRDYNI